MSYLFIKLNLKIFLYIKLIFTLFNLAFFLAVKIAPKLLSIAVISRLFNSFFNAIEMHPEPVPISKREDFSKPYFFI